MQKILPKAIFIYSAIASLFITISTVFVATTAIPVIFIILFLPVTSYFLVEFTKNGIETKFLPRLEEVIVILLIFAVLFGIGLRNVLSQPKKVSVTSSTSGSLIFKIPEATTAPILMTVNITDGSPSVNIRSKPTIYSTKVASVKTGDKLLFISKSGDWYQVSVNAVVGYISKLYIK